MENTGNPNQENSKKPESLKDILKNNPLFNCSLDDVDDSEYTETTQQYEVQDSNPVELNVQEDSYFVSENNSAFEINMSEFPLAYLTKKVPSGVSNTFHEYTDIIKGRNGKPVERTWTIFAHGTDTVKKKDGSKKEVSLGFGGPATFEVIYELFQLWKEQGFKSPRIHIGTYYNFLKRLGWGTGNSQYKLLRKTLRCLHGLQIRGHNCFYMPNIDRYVEIDIFPFPGIRTYSKEEKDINPDDYLYISVDQDFFETIKMNTLFYLPLDRFYFKTLTPMEQKMALMLSKIFSPYRKIPRFEWRRDIFELAAQVPILSNERKIIVKQLKRICDGLLSKDYPFLSTYKIKGNKITFYNNVQAQLSLQQENNITEKKDYDTIEWLVEEQLKICGDKHSRGFYTLVAKYVPVDMIYQALSEAKQEGKVKRKLYTKIILERAKTFLDPHIKSAEQREDTVILPASDVKKLELELQKEKEEFESRKSILDKKKKKRATKKNKEESDDGNNLQEKMF